MLQMQDHIHPVTDQFILGLLVIVAYILISKNGEPSKWEIS